MDITTTFAYWEMLLSTTILPSLVVIVRRSVDIWTKLLTGGQKLASSFRMVLDGEFSSRRYLKKGYLL